MKRQERRILLQDVKNPNIKITDEQQAAMAERVPMLDAFCRPRSIGARSRKQTPSGRCRAQ
jgi:hypothetical protein